MAVYFRVFHNAEIEVSRFFQGFENGFSECFRTLWVPACHHPARNYNIPVLIDSTVLLKLGYGIRTVKNSALFAF